MKNPKSLEGACRRVPPGLARADRFFHERGKLSSGCDSPLPEHLQSPCNRNEQTVSPYSPDDLRDLADGRLRQPFPPRSARGSYPCACRGGVEAKAHPARSVVQLGRRHPEVQQHSIHRLHAQARELVVERALNAECTSVSRASPTACPAAIASGSRSKAINRPAVRGVGAPRDCGRRARRFRRRRGRRPGSQARRPLRRGGR